MKRIDSLFEVHRARSALFDKYEPGPVAYVTNSTDANGVLGYVSPRAGDTVFNFTGIVISSFSRMPNSIGARVQPGPFIACGRSGNGLLVLEPKDPMSVGRLAHMAAYINHAHGWRFTWYRQATKDRLCGLAISDPEEAKFCVRQLLPSRDRNVRQQVPQMQFKAIRLDALFALKAGEYHTESTLDRGKIPLVSCGEENNGVIAYVDVPPENLHQHALTIAFNGRPLTAKFHPYRFAAKDDVGIATPLAPLRMGTLLFVQLMLNRERWRYSYYRKCYFEKLSRCEITLPHTGNNDLDEDAMEACFISHPYWSYLEHQLVIAKS